MEGLKSAQRIMEFHRAIGPQLNSHGIDRKVPADQVTIKAIAVGHFRVAGLAIVAISPEGGYLNLVAAIASRDRAILNSGIPYRLGDLIEYRPHRLRVGRRCKIKIIAQPAQ